MGLVRLCISEAAETWEAFIAIPLFGHRRREEEFKSFHGHRQVHTCDGAIGVELLIAQIVPRRGHVRGRRKSQFIPVVQRLRAICQSTEVILTLVKRATACGDCGVCYIRICAHTADGTVVAQPGERHGYTIYTRFSGVLMAIKIVIFKHQVAQFAELKFVVFDFTEGNRV